MVLFFGGKDPRRLDLIEVDRETEKNRTDYCFCS